MDDVASVQIYVQELSEVLYELFCVSYSMCGQVCQEYELALLFVWLFIGQCVLRSMVCSAVHSAEMLAALCGTRGVSEWYTDMCHTVRLKPVQVAHVNTPLPLILIWEVCNNSFQISNARVTYKVHNIILNAPHLLSERLSESSSSLWHVYQKAPLQ